MKKKARQFYESMSQRRSIR